MNYQRRFFAGVLLAASAFGAGLIAGGFSVTTGKSAAGKPAAQAAAPGDPCCGTVVLDDKIKKQCPDIPKNLSNNTSYSFFNKPCAASAKDASVGSAGGSVAPFTTDDLHKVQRQFSTPILTKKTAALKQIKGKPKTDTIRLDRDNPIHIITFTPTEGKSVSKEINITLVAKNKDSGEGRNVWGAAIFKNGVKTIDNIGPFEGAKGAAFTYTIKPDGSANIKPNINGKFVPDRGYDI